MTSDDVTISRDLALTILGSLDLFVSLIEQGAVVLPETDLQVFSGDPEPHAPELLHRDAVSALHGLLEAVFGT